jgi:glycosyltransferase involved in cell wall biosynthesis
VSTETQDLHGSPQDLPAGSAAESDRRPRVLMLGMGWFPSTLGGLDRYYRSLFEHLPEARGVVIGPATHVPASIRVASRHERSLPRRLFAFWVAARRSSAEVDVVDAHFALYAAAPLLLGRLRRVPTAFHFQGPWAEENVAAQDASRVRFVLRKTLERRVLRAADEHIVLSSAFRRLLVERYRIAPWNVHVWPPAVDLDVFTPGDRSSARARLGLPEGAFVAVCARRLVARMGLDVLLDAWGEIASGLPPGSTLLLAGEGPLAEDLAERTSRSPLAGWVRMLGRLSDDDLIDAYRAADVAVVPSIAFEGFGLVVLEAAGCGTPSIVTAVGGLPEAAAALDASLVVTPGDVPALGGRLQTAAAGRLPSRVATRRYAERFSWPELTERHRKLYRRLAAGERDERLRVVYLDHIARMSGGEIALLRLLPHLEHVNPHVILGEDGPLADRLQRAGISVEAMPLATAAREMRRDTVRPGGASPLAALHTLGYILRLARRLRELKPDIVHTNSLKAGVYGCLAAKLAGAPLVWHLRDRVAEDYLPAAAVRLVRTSIAHLADGIIANSTATLDTLPPRERERGQVIPDSVQTPPRVEPPAGETAGTRPVTFGMLGRIAPWKGQDLFLRAFAAAFPTGGERAVLVGEPMFGEEDYERELHELVARLGLTGRVEFRGFREDIWGELASFEVLVHASVIPEPFGQVVLEGMAAGLPVIAPDEGGPADMIENGRTGRLFASRDPDSLTSAMRALSKDQAERERLGSAARKAAERYTPQILAGSFEEVYDRVLAQRGRGDARWARGARTVQASRGDRR